MQTVPLVGKKAAGRVAQVDDDVFAEVSAYPWHVWEAIRPNGSHSGPYARTSMRCADGRSKVLSMHTLITGWPEVDHKDHDGLNNQRSNLRPATRPQNNANSRKRAGTSSWFKGVCWEKRRLRWQAQIMVDGRTRFLGYFDDEFEAAEAYDAAALWEWGEFACLNFAAADE